MQTQRIARSSVILRSAVVGACLALFAMLLPADSRAQIYIGAEGGWTGLPDRTDDILNVTSVKARFDAGFNAGARGGYEWGPWRFEEEYSYRHNGARITRRHSAKQAGDQRGRECGPDAHGPEPARRAVLVSVADDPGIHGGER